MTLIMSHGRNDKYRAICPDDEDILGPASHFICYGEGKRHRGRAKTRRDRFADFAKRMMREHRTDESLARYLARPRPEQDVLKAEVGFWTPGIYRDGVRQRSHLIELGILALDIDNATPEIFERLRTVAPALDGIEYAFATTRKHKPTAPRLRFAAPLSRSVTFDEYEALSRLVACEIDPTMDAIDVVSYRPVQVMYWPSCSKDSEFVSGYFPGEPIDPDAVFAAFRASGKDPFSFAGLPFGARQGRQRKAAAKAADPSAKGGIIGTFCRVFPIEDAFACFLSELYRPGTADRWSWIDGTTTDGVVFHDGLFATSFHGSDPLAGKTVNAFDAVRISLYGDRDGEDAESLPMGERPSFKAMVALANTIPEVNGDKAEREAERVAALVEAFDEEPDAPGHPPTAAPTRDGEVSEVRLLADDRAPFGDVWNGAAHARRMRGARLYVSATGQTLAWTGQRWAAQTPEDTMADAKETSARLLEAASRNVAADPSPDNRRLLALASRLHSSGAALQRMVEMSRSEPGMNVASPAEFDCNPYELTVRNGIIDLRTGKLRPATPADRVSKLADVTFDPAAEAPTLEAFLERVQPDPEVRGLLRRAAGMAITGDVGEEKFFLLFGTGANGKSVFCEVLEALMNEFAGSFGAALITKNKHENEALRMMARLPGLRLAFVNETAPGDLFDSTRVKELSSRDRISARLLTKEAFDFAPTHTLIIRTNHLLGSLDAGDGFWRRAVPITFGVQIPPEDRVPDLARRIVREELSGVLNWALAGTIEWKRANSLRLPAVIEAARNEYRTDTDLIGQWLEERTVPEAGAKVAVRACYQDYKAYCEERGAHAGTEMVFSRTMTARGYRRDPSRASGRRFMGFRLEAAEDRFLDDSDDRNLFE